MKKLTFSWWWNLVVCVGILIVVVVLWMPTSKLPTAGETAFVWENAANYLLRRNFNPWVLVEFQKSHPPLFSSILSLSLLFGTENRLLFVHLWSLLGWVSLGVWSYLLGKKIGGLVSGIISGFLVLVLPLVLYAGGMVSVEMFGSSLVLGSIYFWVDKKRVLSMIFLSLASLVIPESLLGMVFILSYDFFERKRQDVLSAWKITILPVLVLGVWYVYHNMTVGWWITPPGIEDGLVGNLGQWIGYGRFVLVRMMFGQLRWVFLSLGIVGWLMMKARVDKDMALRNWWLGWGASLLTMVGFWGVRGNFVDLDGLWLIVLMLVGAVSSSKKILIRLVGEDAVWYQIGLWCLIFVAHLVLWRPSVKPVEAYSFRESYDLSYQDMIYIGRQAAKYVEIAYDDAVVYGGYPEVYQLTEPVHGYVESQIRFDLCNGFSPNEEVVQILYIHPYHPTQLACKNILERYRFEQITRFESGSKWTELYRYVGDAEISSE